MPVQININDFLSFSKSAVVLDVRTPAEFHSGHVPGAVNLPLFNDEERKIVGTLYKQQGRQVAILKGLELVGPRLKQLVTEAEKIAEGRPVLMYCWRGGMRSSSMAWLLEMYGFKIQLLKGGYKSFRKKTFGDHLPFPGNLQILGGRTGSGKTLILQELKKQGEQVLDLENIACHKGSSFGSLGENSQPSQEQFENIMAFQLLQLDPNRLTWVEDESRMVGNKAIPGPFWEQMRRAPVTYIDISFEERVKYLVQEYGKFTKDELKAAIARIEKRLGNLNTRLALNSIEEGDLKLACELSLNYYDKSYDHGLSKREHANINRITFNSLDKKNISETIIASPKISA